VPRARDARGMPFTPRDICRQATGWRVAALRIATWPLARNAISACEKFCVNVMLCACTGRAPVEDWQSAAVAPDRSMVSRAPGSDTSANTLSG
jgi:hypothetical protein